MTTIPARIAVWVIGFVLALIAICATGVFLCVALYNALCLMIAPPWAALAAAALMLFVAILILTIAGAIAGALRRQTRKSVKPSANIIGAEIGRMIGEDAQAAISKNPKTTIIFAIIAGFAIGLSPRLRDIAMRFLKG